MADSRTFTQGPIPWGSNVVNGVLVPQAPNSAIFPLDMGAQYRMPGAYPRQGSYQVPPVIQSPMLGPEPIGASGTYPTGTQDVGPEAGRSSNPWHPTQGVIIFGFGALIIGLFALQYIHYGG